MRLTEKGQRMLRLFKNSKFVRGMKRNGWQFDGAIGFYSCRIIPTTPEWKSALEGIERTSSSG